MAIDYWALTKDFVVGDLVQKFFPGYSNLSPYTGRVTAVLKGIGFLDVQWPFGNERVSPEEVVRVDRDIWWLPPISTSSYYPGLDARESRQKEARASVWDVLSVPPGFHRELAKVFHKGASEVRAYDALWHRYRDADDEAIRGEVSKFYRMAHNMVTALIIEEARRKDAAYWAATDRKYRATKMELAAKKVNCPKCKQAHLRKATYKMENGQRMQLLACPHCMHLVKQTDVMGPAGEQVAW